MGRGGGKGSLVCGLCAKSARELVWGFGIEVYKVRYQHYNPSNGARGGYRKGKGGKKYTPGSTLLRSGIEGRERYHYNIINPNNSNTSQNI